MEKTWKKRELKIQEMLKVKLQIEDNVEMDHFHHVPSKRKKQKQTNKQASQTFMHLNI